ncbi:MAG: hypothetical protein K0Q55_4027 [Verrucomicrobia bacterium]|nr:hypothetical protein [Verrucomicrobiota bacterium]
MISLEDGTLKGPGADFLLNEAKGTQFVALGEQHFNRDIPKITTALFKALQSRYGFQYLATEYGAFPIRLLVEKPYRGNVDKITEHIKAYPFSLAFDSDQDLEMLADIGALSKAKGRPIWGLDQDFGAVAPLEFLLKRAKTEQGRAATQKLLDKARAIEAKREREHFMAGHAKAEDFRDLRLAYGPKPGSEEDTVLSQLALSQEVYAYYDGNGPNGEPVGRLNNLVREENMKDLFMEEYRLAQRRCDRLPKVILKFGQWHLYRGMSPGTIFPTGNMISEFAKTNGMNSLHINFVAHTTTELPDDNAYLNVIKPFLKATSLSEWALYDMRPLRNYYHAGLLPPLGTNFLRNSMGFDFMWVLGGSQRATTTRAGRANP